MEIVYTMGRPLEYSQEDHDNIVEAYKHTLTLGVVAGLVGRDDDTIKGWLKRGRADVLAGNDTPLARFFGDVKRAQANSKLIREQMLMKGVDNWQRIAWLLERTCREHYGADAGIIQELKDEFELIKAKMESHSNG